MGVMQTSCEHHMGIKGSASGLCFTKRHAPVAEERRSGARAPIFAPQVPRPLKTLALPCTGGSASQDRHACAWVVLVDVRDASSDLGI